MLMGDCFPAEDMVGLWKVFDKRVDFCLVFLIDDSVGEMLPELLTDVLHRLLSDSRLTYSFFKYLALLTL